MIILRVSFEDFNQHLTSYVTLCLRFYSARILRVFPRFLYDVFLQKLRLVRHFQEEAHFRTKLGHGPNREFQARSSSVAT